MTNVRKQQNSIKNIIGKYNDGEITFGEMLRRISVKPTVRNFVIIVAIITAIATTKDVFIERIVKGGNDKTSTNIEQLDQIVITLPIKKGDTLNKIAERFGTTAEIIAKYNGIEDPNKINAGDTISILLPLETTLDIIEEYTVQKDETIESICKANNMSVEEFLAINPDTVGVVDGDTVKVLVERQIREYRHYLVEEGDTIDSLVEKYDLDKQVFLNTNDLLADSELEKGTILVLLTEEAIYESYEVKKDETIQDVADKFGVTVEDIMNLNEITEVIPGEIIEIPSRKATEKKTLCLF